MTGPHRIVTGDSVTIAAKDDFYAFVNGWCGSVTGWNEGHAEVVCIRPDGEKTLFVPPDQLQLTEQAEA